MKWMPRLCYNTGIEPPRRLHRTMLIIGIAGGTGSGKTTVARSVIEQLGTSQVTFISQDNYYKDHPHLTMAEREALNYDHPLVFDNELLIEHLKQLLAGQPA